MRSSKLSALDQNLTTLGLSLPTDVVKYRKQLTELSSLPTHEGSRGVKHVDDIKAEIEARTLDSIMGREKANQIRLMADDINSAIDSTLIRSTEDILDTLKPIVVKAHKTILEASQKLGEMTTEAAVATDNVKAYRAAQDAWKVLDTACSIREALYSLDRPALEAGTVRALTLFRFSTLSAWEAYDRLQDAGSGAGNHALTLSTEGVEPAWLSTDEAEQQSLALGKAQRAQREANRPADTYTFDPTVGAYVSDGF